MDLETSSLDNIDGRKKNETGNNRKTQKVLPPVRKIWEIKNTQICFSIKYFFFSIIFESFKYFLRWNISSIAVGSEVENFYFTIKYITKNRNKDIFQIFSLDFCFRRIL